MRLRTKIRPCSGPRKGRNGLVGRVWVGTEHGGSRDWLQALWLTTNLKQDHWKSARMESPRPGRPHG